VTSCCWTQNFQFIRELVCVPSSARVKPLRDPASTTISLSCGCIRSMGSRSRLNRFSMNCRGHSWQSGFSICSKSYPVKEQIRTYPATKDFDAITGTLPSNAHGDGGKPIVVEQSSEGKAASRHIPQWKTLCITFKLGHYRELSRRRTRPAQPLPRPASKSKCGVACDLRFLTLSSWHRGVTTTSRGCQPICNASPFAD
jgi:hypothetical protein